VYRDDLPERVNEMGEGGFHLSPPLSKWAIESQWQNRNRVVRFRAQFHATTLTLPSVPSVPQILYMAGDGTNHALHIVKKGPVYTYQVNQEDEAGEAVPFSLYRAGDGTQHKVGVQATGGIYTLFVDQADTPGEAIDSIVFAADDGTLHETSVGLSGTAVYTFQVNQHAA
jgi:putative intracellular protease/amidase